MAAECGRAGSRTLLWQYLLTLEWHQKETLNLDCTRGIMKI